MKKLLFFFLVLLACKNSMAKKVMFQVDMTGVNVNVTGVHITGDFQVAAGFGGNNFDCNVMTMIPNANDSNLYQLLVNIPAFQKYEFMFVNGDQCYEVEFVPLESRANYNFSDYRWIFIDSLVNDTTYLPAIRFAQNAPQGLTLVRFKVNMQNIVSISPEGVHVAGNFQSWLPSQNRMYSFANNVYEIISYVDTGNYDFRYFNGNTIASSENVPAACSNNGDRYIYVTQDTVLDILCFSSCTLCWPNAVSTVQPAIQLPVYPNPNDGIFQINLPEQGQLQAFDLTGRMVAEFPLTKGIHSFDWRNKPGGLYHLRISLQNGQTAHSKLFIR